LESLLSLDRLIDSIAQTLGADGRLERTWIIFTADNGLTLGEHRLTDSKKCPYEECIRVPLIVVPPPGVAVPRSDGHVVANIDLAPTVAAILGADVGGPVDGRSLLPLLADPSTPWREGVVIEQWSDSGEPSWIAVRTADRKYVRYPNGEEELYDGRADPYELQSLGSDASRAAEKAELAARLQALTAE
jgi:N-acetylglucosamine-6-sulfatase